MDFLFLLALILLIVASIQDIRKREVDNWLSFSLIAFSLAYVIFYSLLNQDISFFLHSLLGLTVFIALGFAFYYGRVFAGGDAKLIMGIGIIIGLTNSYLNFLLLLLISGAIYGTFYTLFISIKHRKKFAKEFKLLWKNEKKIYFVLASIILLLPAILLQNAVLLALPALAILFPVILIYGKAVENCLIFSKSYKELTVGDWLYKSIKLKNKTIHPHWEGLTESQIALLQKNKKNILIKDGVPFVPAILLALILWNSHFNFW